ncbi:MAG: peptidoglycan-binding domain-containing protein [Hyphomicrobiales bacterium]
MQDIVGDTKRKAWRPIFVSMLTVVSAGAISWNALVGQPVSNPGHAEIAGHEQIGTGLPVEVKQADPTVQSIQSALQRMEIYTDEVDGLSGPVTRKAVRAYQTRFGLPQTGKADEELLAHILYNEKLEQAVRYTGSTTPRTPEANTGRESPSNLAIVQKGLSELGYQPGPIDGQFGEKTRAAIREFQRDRSLAVTGDLSPEMLAELGKVTGKSTLENM